MAFDGVFLNKTILEIRDNLIGCRIDKIYQPSKDEFIFNVRKKDFSGKLLLSANSVSARIQFTTSSFENPDTPPMLCMLLRKKLVGGLVEDITQHGLERICYINIATKNEFGDDCSIKIIVEIMGKNSNIIFVSDDNKVIDAVRRTDATSTVRILMPGIKYQNPPTQEKIDILLSGTDKIKDILLTENELPISDTLQNNLQGFCPSICRELEHYTDSVNQIIEKLKKVTSSSYKVVPTIVHNLEDKAIDFSYLPITYYGTGYKNEVFPSLCEVLDAFYSKKDRDMQLNTKKHELSRTINNSIARINRKIDAQSRELASSNNAEEKRVFGELIKANLHCIKKGDTQVTVQNFYDENLALITIPIKNELSPAANAQKYFKEYRKACTARQLLGSIIEKGRNELIYLDSVADTLKRASTFDEITEIRSELISSGYIRRDKEQKNKNNKKKPTIETGGKPKKYISDDGFVIFSGKNNKQNDYLTTKLASKNDIWFHIKDSAGSHVIVFSDNKQVPDTTLFQAATIAAVNSSVGDSNATVSIDYCPVKNVKKPPSFPPGMVTYESYKTAIVKPDNELAQRLLNDKK